MNYMGAHVVLVPSTVTYATATARTTYVDTKYYKEGVFFLEAVQTAYVDETIAVNIQTYDEVTDDWYTIITFTTVGNATGTVQEAKRIDYAMGNRISCNWAVTGGDTGHKYTITVSGVLK